MIELGEKYVFHIPMYRYVDDELVPIELDELLDDLLLKLANGGFDSLYMTKAKSYYKSRCFDELLLTIFASSSSPVDIFKKWFRASNDVMSQEAFAWECGNSLFIESLDD
ncbi:hypothetical protein [Methanobrevibacter sp.]|uniref:hypothetical protein n=1 Tax=Methanobrevibacter sp. TaxID=66852 RepID=UPI00386BED34